MPGTVSTLTVVVVHTSLEVFLVRLLLPLFLQLPIAWLTEIRLLLRIVHLEEFLPGYKLRGAMQEVPAPDLVKLTLSLSLHPLPLAINRGSTMTLLLTHLRGQELRDLGRREDERRGQGTIPLVPGGMLTQEEDLTIALSLPLPCQPIT